MVGIDTSRSPVLLEDYVKRCVCVRVCHEYNRLSYTMQTELYRDKLGLSLLGAGQRMHMCS